MGRGRKREEDQHEQGKPNNRFHCGPPIFVSSAWGENVAMRFSLFVRYWVRRSRLLVDGCEDIALSSSTKPFATPGSKSRVVCFCAFQTVIRSCSLVAAVAAGSASFGSAKAALIISSATCADATETLRSS